MGVAGREVEEEEGYLPNSIPPPILVGIRRPHCQCLLGMLEDYSESAWQFLDIVKCHMDENCLSYTAEEGFLVLQLRNCTISTTTSPNMLRQVPIDSQYAIYALIRLLANLIQNW